MTSGALANSLPTGAVSIMFPVAVISTTVFARLRGRVCRKGQCSVHSRRHSIDNGLQSRGSDRCHAPFRWLFDGSERREARAIKSRAVCRCWGLLRVYCNMISFAVLQSPSLPLSLSPSLYLARTHTHPPTPTHTRTHTDDKHARSLARAYRERGLINE